MLCVNSRDYGWEWWIRADVLETEAWYESGGWGIKRDESNVLISGLEKLGK